MKPGNVSVKDVTTRWKNIKDYRARKLSKLPSGSGAAAAAGDTSSYLRALSFLDPVVQPKRWVIFVNSGGALGSRLLQNGRSYSPKAVPPGFIIPKMSAWYRTGAVADDNVTPCILKNGTAWHFGHVIRASWAKSRKPPYQNFTSQAF